MTASCRALVHATQTLARQCRSLSFGSPATHVYHPLDYAWAAHKRYLETYAATPKKALYLGINPGPWGMAQTGIPFGDVASVRDWLGITADITAPADASDKRPVLGFACPRAEISGQRLWHFFRQRYQTPDAFFADNFVLNYCPLLFLAINERQTLNLTPDKLRAAETKPLYAYCDEFLRRVVELLKPEYLIGVGGFAEARLKMVFAADDIRIGKILHPSPASPSANRGFAEAAAAQLDALGVR